MDQEGDLNTSDIVELNGAKGTDAIRAAHGQRLSLGVGPIAWPLLRDVELEIHGATHNPEMSNIRTSLGRMVRLHIRRWPLKKKIVARSSWGQGATNNRDAYPTRAISEMRECRPARHSAV